jgi:hypothetical protein
VGRKRKEGRLGRKVKEEREEGRGWKTRRKKGKKEGRGRKEGRERKEGKSGRKVKEDRE